MAQPADATVLPTASTSNTRDISLVSELAETKQENERLREKIRRLRGAVAALTNEVASINDVKEEAEEVGIMRGSAEGDADGEESGSDVDGDDLALWDGDCFRCPECNFEVHEDCGICIGACSRIWICFRDDGDEKVDKTDPILAETGLAMHPDRVLYPRGYSPVPLHQDLAEPTPIPLMYTGRADEFRALLARGASEQMCVRYHLVLDNTTGIIALADTLLHDEYCNPTTVLSNIQWYILRGARRRGRRRGARGDGGRGGRRRGGRLGGGNRATAAAAAVATASRDAVAKIQSGYEGEDLEQYSRRPDGRPRGSVARLRRVDVDQEARLMLNAGKALRSKHN